MIRREIFDLPCALKAISKQATVMAVAVGEMSICSKLGPKSFGDGIQDICKDTESYLEPFSGF